MSTPSGSYTEPPRRSRHAATAATTGIALAPGCTLTTAALALYSEAMTQENTREQFIQELARLENRIGELAEVCAKLRRDNHSLSERLESLSAERSGLLAKNEHVRGRVEAIITRLKSLEESA